MSIGRKAGEVLTVVVVDDDWVADAACVEYPTELFFNDGFAANAENRLAIKIACAGCAVRLECLESALQEEQGASTRRYGIRGGMSANEREVYWREAIARGAGWCAKQLHIVEHDEGECSQCQLRGRKKRPA